MPRLALHWQILIGMIAGAALGIALNVLGGTRSTRLETGLPPEIASLEISDTSDRVVLVVTEETGEQRSVVVDPLSDDPRHYRSLEALRAAEPPLARLYQQRGRSTARTAGEWFQRIGNLFLRLLQMIAVPLIITSLLTGILGLGSSRQFGWMFSATVLYYVATSALAITTGLLVVNLMRPGLRGEGLAAVAAGEAPLDEPVGLAEVLYGQLLSLIPANPFAALVEPNFLSIIAFTLAFAIFTLRVGGEAAELTRRAAQAGFDILMAMTRAIIALAPLGVFFLMAYVTASQGGAVFASLAWYLTTVSAALLIHAVIVLPLIVRLVTGRNPLRFGQAMSPALLTAFSSASSNATLPLTLANLQQRAGVRHRTSSFVVPLGATINMDGTALYEAVAVLFIAQLHFGQNLPLDQQIVVALTALLASIGAAGIPHAGLVMMVIILQAVNLPVELQGIILAVDRLLDMARTAVNVWSDSCGAAVIDALPAR